MTWTQSASAGLLLLLAMPASPAAPPEQPDLTAVKSDFIPGEKNIFFDDLSDMAGGEPPPHWKARGGTAELRVGGGIRQLTLTRHGQNITANLKGLPKNFTLEATLKFDGAGGNGVGAIWTFAKKDGSQVLGLSLTAQLEDENPQRGICGVELVAGDPRESSERIADPKVKLDPGQPVEVALWAQDGRVRLYINGNREADVNQVKLDDIENVELKAGIGDDNPKMALGVRRVRFAESAPDASKTILSSGRYVTHGILFDTDSDRMKPESAPVVRQIARALETNAALKLLIEGHTDSTGAAERNMDLSRRRAEAVKLALVSQFKIAGDRLTTAGLGPSKPIDSNDTPAGRAQNRRVEFVRQ